MESELQSLDPKTQKPPETRIKDCASLNSIVKKIIEADAPAALNRVNVQKSLDGTPPYDDRYLQQTGQDGRCNLNFGDAKAIVKLECAGYYDLTESVPTLAYVQTDFGAETERHYYNSVMSEEWHRTLKDWKKFDSNHQLLIQKRVSHGLGFLYFRDDVDWRWEVAGLDEFKLPRTATLSEDECEVAVVLKDLSATQLYKWIKDLSETDARWNLAEVRKAMMNASSDKSLNTWDKYQEAIKNNDTYISTLSDTIKVAYVWSREFSGKLSIYLTLREGGNDNYLFKLENQFDCANECFNFFPYEVGTNGMLHGVRGRGHEIYAGVQVLNSLRCQSVDNAKLSGSLLLQPATETDAEDMAIMFYGGAAYLPPNLKVQNATLANANNNILPVLDEMSLVLRTGDTNTRSNQASQREKTKFEVQGDMTKEGVLPTADMNLFYQPWGRHLNEVWRRFANKKLRKEDPGAEEVFEFRERCVARNVPLDAIYEVKRVTPVRAVGYGSPSARLLALDEFMQYYGSLDPVGQNNLLRDRFAQRVGYGQVDRYVPRIEEGGRAPVDIEIAELQNVAMSAGKEVSVRPNDHHLLHLSAHFPDIQNDLTNMESGGATPELLQVVQIKIQHIAEHMKTLKPDKLNKEAVSENQRLFNNTAERVDAAMLHAEKAAKQEPQPGVPDPKMEMAMQEHQVKQQMKVEDHQLTLQLREEDAAQKRVIADAASAAKLRAEANKQRILAGGSALPAAPAPVAPLPAPAR